MPADVRSAAFLSLYASGCAGTILAKRAGLPIIAARKQALLQGYKDLKRMTALMFQYTLM